MKKLWAVAILALAAAAVALPVRPAHAAPVSAHAMVHACCTPAAMKERVFAEASSLGADYIRVDVELSGIFEGPGGVVREEPDWKSVDEVVALSEKYDLRVLGILLAPPAEITTCHERWPDAGRCAASHPVRFGELAGEVAARAEGTIRDWEILNEPDGAWAFEGSPEEYARMLSAAHDAIKARAPAARVVFGGMMGPDDPAWLERVFATPGADAARKFDIGGVHLRGPVGAVVRRYGAFRALLATHGFSGPLWVTEHGYPADPAFQVDPAFAGGDAAQAAYLTQSVVGLGEAGAEQVFVTLRDNLEGEYATEGLANIDAGPGHAVTRRQSFAALRRLAENWDRVMAWRGEQRVNEYLMQMHAAVASVSAAEARIARTRWQAARTLARDALVALASRSQRPRRVLKLLERRLARARALAAARRTALIWHSGYAREQRGRGQMRALVVEALKRQVAGG